MTQDDAVVVLFALAHPGRLSVFRVIVAAGEKGMPAGQIARTVGIPANTASTHLSILTGAGLLNAYRDGRSIIYRSNLGAFADLLVFLSDDCAQKHDIVLEALDGLFEAAPKINS